MKIYLSCLQSKQKHPIPSYDFWELYFKKGIEEGGHHWFESDVDWAEPLLYQHDKEALENWKSKTWTKVLEDIKALKDKEKDLIFLSYLYPLHIEEQAIKEIQAIGVPCINFFCDNVREFRKIPEAFKVFDLNWVPEYKALSMYKDQKLNYIHLPMPMWVDPGLRNVTESDNKNICFIGSGDIQRQMLFEEILKKNVALEIYGAGWENEEKNINPLPINMALNKFNTQFEFIAKEGLVAYFRKLTQRNLVIQKSGALKTSLKGRINLDHYINITKTAGIIVGINRYPSFRHPFLIPDTYSRLRDIEAPMLGACYLTEHTPSIDQMYKIGAEIETYKNADEFAQKANMLLNNPQLRKKMKSNGQKKALNELSIVSSLNQLETKLK